MREIVLEIVRYVSEDLKLSTMNPPLNELPQFLHCKECRRVFPKSDLKTGRASTSPEGGFLCMRCLEALRRDFQIEEIPAAGLPVAGSSHTQERYRGISLLAILCYGLSYPPMLYLLRGLQSTRWGVWESLVASFTVLCLLGSISVCLLKHRGLHTGFLGGIVVLSVINLGFVALALMGLSPF